MSEAQLQGLIGIGRDPISGDPLGHAFPAYKSISARVEARIADLDPAMGPGAKGGAVAQIEAEEAERAGGGSWRGSTSLLGPEFGLSVVGDRSPTQGPRP